MFKVIWANSAVKGFEKQIDYISNTSVQNAIKFKTDILSKIELIAQYPENYSLDKYRIKNDGTFRALEIHKIRISYRFINDTVQILRLRHTKQAPQQF